MSKGGGGHLEVARKTLADEANSILRTMESLDGSFERTVDALLGASGKTVVTGSGKSGHVARKVAATLASTGTPAFFVHPADAVHGDLGMLAEGDALLAMSFSGESEEIGAMAEHCRRFGVPVLLLTGDAGSTLAKAADVTVEVRALAEACPLNLAPTSSTTATLAVGDAIAMALLAARGFTAEDFALTHPGGALGRRLLLRVSDLMVTGDGVPVVDPKASVAEAVVTMSEKRLGMTLVGGGARPGIFTDGDLRRCLEKTGDLSSIAVGEVMTPEARTIGADSLAAEALAVMEGKRITHLVAVDGGEVKGVIDVHRLMQAKVA